MPFPISRNLSAAACKVSLRAKAENSFNGLFYILRFEETFCVGSGNAVHIDVAGAQKRQVAMSHIELKAWQVGVVLGVEACVCVAKNVLNPTSAKTRIVPNFAPATLPVGRADFFLF